MLNMKRRIILFIGFLALIVLAAACQNKQINYDAELEKLCNDRTPGNWMNMRPMTDGKFTSDTSCWGCMSDDGMGHYCSIDEYTEYLSGEQ
jgi:hypothetical protein